MNIFKYELKANAKSTIIWLVSLVLVVFLFMSIYQSFAKDAPQAQDFLTSLPPAARAALGINMDTFFTVLGFYSFVFLYIVLIGAIQAMNLGLGMLSKETREKTADFLLTKPVTRQFIVTSKMLAALTAIIITNIVFLLISYVILLTIQTNNFSGKIFFMLSITLLFIQIFFFAIGFILSVVIPKIKTVIAISLPIVFGFFIISMIGSIIGEKAVHYLTPFEYFNREYILEAGAYQLRFILIEMVIVIGLIFSTYYIYTKKDIHSI